MSVPIAKQLAELNHLTTSQLREKFIDVFGEASRANNKPWLIKRIAWRIQSLAEGDLSERARQRAAELARDSDLRVTAPKPPKDPAVPMVPTKGRAGECKTDKRLPMAGSVITRRYKGQTLQVRVLPTGFEYEGDEYKSLSAVAKAITGSHCNGYLFFGLVGEKS